MKLPGSLNRPLFKVISDHTLHAIASSSALPAWMS